MPSGTARSSSLTIPRTVLTFISLAVVLRFFYTISIHYYSTSVSSGLQRNEVLGLRFFQEDAERYLPRAMELAVGGNPETTEPVIVIYAWFFQVFGENTLALFLLLTILSSTVPILLYYAAMNFWDDYQIGTYVLLISMISPPLVHWGAMPTKEPFALLAGALLVYTTSKLYDRDLKLVLLTVLTIVLIYLFRDQGLYGVTLGLLSYLALINRTAFRNHRRLVAGASLVALSVFLLSLMPNNPAVTLPGNVRIESLVPLIYAMIRGALVPTPWWSIRIPRPRSNLVLVLGIFWYLLSPAIVIGIAESYVGNDLRTKLLSCIVIWLFIGTSVSWAWIHGGTYRFRTLLWPAMIAFMTYGLVRMRRKGIRKLNQYTIASTILWSILLVLSLVIYPFYFVL